MVLEDFSLKDEDVLNIYPYGSRVYGTFSVDSDFDYIIVAKDNVVDRDSLDSSYHKINATIYSESSFKKKIVEHSVSAIECLSVSPSTCLKHTKSFVFNYDRSTLRSSFSEKSSHSWVKAKKKFEVEKDRNVYIAKKSLFHSMRIADFAIQIALSPSHTISNFTSCVDLWKEINENPAQDWPAYKVKYQDEYNSLMSQFRKLAPK